MDFVAVSQISYGSKFLRSDWSSCKHIYPWNLPCPNLQSKVNSKVSIGGFRSFHVRPWATACRNKKYGFFCWNKGEQLHFVSSKHFFSFLKEVFHTRKNLKTRLWFKPALTCIRIYAVSYCFIVLCTYQCNAGGGGGRAWGWDLTFSKICSQIPCPRANHSSQMQPNFPTPGCTLLSIPRQNPRKAE